MHSARTLFWFHHDLRVEDNAALAWAARSSEQLLCVYVCDPAVHVANHFQSARIGAFQWQFIVDCLHDLDRQLKHRGQQLCCLNGPMHEQLAGACLLYTSDAADD